MAKTTKNQISPELEAHLQTLGAQAKDLFGECTKGEIRKFLLGLIFKDGIDAEIERRFGAIRAAVAAGDANAAALATLDAAACFGTLLMFDLAPCTLKDLNRLAAQKKSRKTEANNRTKLAQDLLRLMPDVEKQRGKMHVYQKIADQMGNQLSKGGKQVSVSVKSVRNYLAGADW